MCQCHPLSCDWPLAGCGLYLCADSMHIHEFIIQISLNSDGLSFSWWITWKQVKLLCDAWQERAMQQIHPPSEHRSVQHSCSVGGPSNYCFVNLVYPYEDSRAEYHFSACWLSQEGSLTHSMCETWADSFYCWPLRMAVCFPACCSSLVGCLEALGRIKWPVVSAASRYVPRGSPCGRNI